MKDKYRPSRDGARFELRSLRRFAAWVAAHGGRNVRIAGTAFPKPAHFIYCRGLGLTGLGVFYDRPTSVFE